MKLKALVFPLILAMSATSCAKPKEEQKDSEPSFEPRVYEKVESDTLYAKKVIESDDQDFILGMDVSSVLAEEASGVKYYNFKGEEEDLFKIISDNGVNTIRVRIWNNPYDDEGHGFGGGNNDLAHAVEIGKRATANKMKLLVDFHYSDFWADPAKQEAPRAWEDLSVDEKAEEVYKFTKESLEELKKNNIVVGMVQVGNETNGGRMAGVTGWGNFAKLFSQGSKAVREVYPDAKVACHFTNPEKNGQMIDYAFRLDYYKLDYDVFGTSWYPWWHGDLNNLSETLSTIANTYNKEVMVMETSYAFTREDTDFGGNTSPTDGDVTLYPISVAGQSNHVNLLADTIKNKTTNGVGICYWEGAWITVGDNWDDNSAKWEEYGSGWASSYASVFDADVREFGPGGSMVDNQAFFDKDGKPLESLKIWNLMRFGNDVETYIDGVEDLSLTYYTTDDFTLPTTVNAIYSDNSKRNVPVTWEEFDIEAAKAAGNNRYQIKGVADAGSGKTYDVTLNLNIMEKNFIKNYSFEDGQETGVAGELTWEPWVLTNRSATEFSDTYVVKVTNENPHPDTGTTHNMNYWSKNANVVNFDLEQDIDVSELPSGTYKYQISLMGGSATQAEQTSYMYVKINDVIVSQLDVYTTKYQEWHDFLLSDIAYTAGDKLTVGVHIESVASGVWGSIEDCMLNFVA